MTVAQAPEPTRDRILRLADPLFARHGYAAVSMRQVAGAAGVTKPALYYHFRDKEALFEECVLASQRRMEPLLREAAAADRPFRDTVESVVDVLLTASPHHPVRTQSDVAEHLPAEARHRIGASFQQSVSSPIAELFAGAADRGELGEGITPALASAALLGLALAFLPPPAGETADEVSHPTVAVDGTAALGDPAVAAATVTRLVLGGVGRQP